jgi:hypothetical protein
VIADIIDFFQDPANSLILYAISVFLILDGIILHIVRKKVVNKAIGSGVAVGGDNSGIIVTGKVKGDVSQHRQVTSATSDNPSPNAQKNAATVDRTFSLLANFSAIVGLILAALTFYLTFYSGPP